MRRKRSRSNRKQRSASSRKSRTHRKSLLVYLRSRRMRKSSRRKATRRVKNKVSVRRLDREDRREEGANILSK